MSSEPPSQAIKMRVLMALLVVSGFCGLSYEVLYARLLGNFIGDQFAVTAAILLTFMLGIGVGTLTAHRMWRRLWLIELAIGGVAASAALGASGLESFIYDAIPSSGQTLSVSVLVCASLLMVPSFLIGASLPLFAGYVARVAPGRVFGAVYSLYNVGAAITVLTIEYWLLRRFGIRGAILVIAGLNGITGISLRLFMAEIAAAPPAPSERERFASTDVLALATAGVASAIFQLVMIKVAECFLGPFRETFALVLSVVLLGIAFGTLWTMRWRVAFGTVMITATLGLLWTLVSFPIVARTYATLYASAVTGPFTHVILKFAALAVLMGIPAIAFGATVPALMPMESHVARDSGRLLFVASFSNALGFLLTVFVLHQRFEYGTLLSIVAGLAALALVLQRPGRPLMLAAATLAMVAVYLAATSVWREKLLQIGYTEFYDREDLTAAESELTASERYPSRDDLFVLASREGSPYFFINGYVSMYLDTPHEKLVAAMSSMLSPRTDKALVLGIGSGMTAGTVGVLFDSTDAVEINPAVYDNVYRMAKYNFNMTERPSIHRILDDGIRFTRVSHDKYSLILNTVTSPIYFSASKLYTRDFLEIVRTHLTPDGVYVTWVDARVGDRGMDILLNTLSESFSSCWLTALQRSYFLLACSNEPVKLAHPELVAEHKEVADYFRSADFGPDELPYTLLSTHVLDFVGDKLAPINTLDHPVLEFEMARKRDWGFPKFVERVRNGLSYAEVREALAPMKHFDPIEDLLYWTDRFGDSQITDRWLALAAPSIPNLAGRLDDARKKRVP